eukprot:CCRYP_017342-RA/>CCRYP_017342-RA protein AED:0.48 eAED:0.48 QI:53/1/1/1/0/0/2/63/32
MCNKNAMKHKTLTVGVCIVWYSRVGDENVQRK